MNKEKIKKSVIIGGIILVVLILVGSFYFKKTIKNEEEKNIEGEQNSLVKEDDAVIANESKSQETPVDAEAKFNGAMLRAQTSFQKKEYARAISFYKEALIYKKSDVVYAGLYTVYSAQLDLIKAQDAIAAAIKLQPSYTDYWNWKIDLLDEKTIMSYQNLKTIYSEALSKVDSRTKINLVTHFARIAENNNEKDEAIALWKYAIEIYPSNSTIYQSEIDRLEQVL